MRISPPSIASPSPVVALTGGIGSGKSEAAKQFEILGVPVVDTDVIARELTARGMPVLADISQLLGADFLTADGTLDRPKLRAHIFNHREDRIKLEALIHPIIYQSAIKKLTENSRKPGHIYQVIVVPLLFENDRYNSIANKKLVIDCDENLQIKRVMSRSQLTESEVKTMMLAQINRDARLSLADEVIENNGSIAELQNKINEFHKKFIKTCIVSK